MKKNNSLLCYKSPATQWCEAMPLGNGRLAAMVYGALTNEILQINEETVWAGNKTDRVNPKAYEALQKMRKAIFEGDHDKLDEYSEDMLGVPKTLNSYQPLCDVLIHVEQKEIMQKYERCLDLNDGFYTQSFWRRADRWEFPNGVEAFCSMADEVIAWRRHIYDPYVRPDIIIGMRRMSDIDIKAEGDTLCMTGTVEGGGVDFCCMLKVYTDGVIIARKDDLLIQNSQKIEIRIAGATNYQGGDPVKKCADYLASADKYSFEELHARHSAIFRKKMENQVLCLECDDKTRTVSELLEDARCDMKARNELDCLLYTYLRYMLLCSCGNGCVPSNMRGIWNDAMQAPWNSDYHPNINMQINYWTADAFNMPECVTPLIDWMKKIAVNGARTAKLQYNAGGWVLHHVSDIYGCTEPMDGPWGLWPFGGIWMLRTVYEHYLFNPDKEFLNGTLLPLVEGAVRFILDFLVVCPDGIPGAGKLVTCPSHSPENCHFDENGKPVWLTYASTMDIEIIRDLFMIYKHCTDESGTKGQYIDEVIDAESRLPELQISKRYGGICEWIDDFEECEPGHRHVSHLYAVYPGSGIDDSTPNLQEAAKKTLERRLTNKYHGQAWSFGWISCIYARLGDGNNALKILDTITNESLLENLMVVAHGVTLVSDGQAMAAAMLEMLVQYKNGEILLLPALPDRWANGSLKGLRVHGGHLIDLVWENGVLTSAEITPVSDEVRTFIINKKRVTLSLKKGINTQIIQ